MRKFSNNRGGNRVNRGNTRMRPNRSEVRNTNNFNQRRRTNAGGNFNQQIDVNNLF